MQFVKAYGVYRLYGLFATSEGPIYGKTRKTILGSDFWNDVWLQFHAAVDSERCGGFLHETLQITLSAVFGWIIPSELIEKKNLWCDHIDAYDGKTRIRYLTYLGSVHPRFQGIGSDGTLQLAS